MIPRSYIEKIMMTKTFLMNPYFMILSDIMRVSAKSNKNMQILNKITKKMKCRKSQSKRKEYNFFLHHIEENKKQNMFLPVNDEWEQQQFDKMKKMIPEFE